MNSLASIYLSVRSLGRNKVRTFLTMLGMIIGVCAVITMVGIGNGAKSQIENQIASLGQNVVLIFSGSFTRGGVHSGVPSQSTRRRAGDCRRLASCFSARTTE